jgi:hypothetical protein
LDWQGGTQVMPLSAQQSFVFLLLFPKEGFKIEE